MGEVQALEASMTRSVASRTRSRCMASSVCWAAFSAASSRAWPAASGLWIMITRCPQVRGRTTTTGRFPENLSRDLTRTDRDPAWPLILAQLAGRAPDPLACDAPLAAAVAAQAAAQGLAFIDRAAVADAVTNGTLELVLPGWQWRRRTWMPHQDCSCSSTTFRRGE
jgi:hypothetical protein